MTKAFMSLNVDFIFWGGFGRFFETDFLYQKDLSLLVLKTEMVTSRTGVTSLAGKQEVSNHNFSASA